MRGALAALALLALGAPAGGASAIAVGDGRVPVVRPAARELTIVASGDLLVHQPVWARALANGFGRRYEFRPMFRAVRPLLRDADLALCHVETPMGAGAPSGYPIFNAPASLAPAIAWAGWDACSTASNHSVDRGSLGVRTTLRALDRAGVRHTGTARTRREGRRILLLEAEGIQVALLSYTYGTNGLPRPTPWSVNLLDPGRVARDARRARRRGADLVVVNFHWGVEYVHEPTAQQRAIARRLLRRGAVDLIVGQHAHVVQPIRRLHGRFVAFGEGNFLSAQTSACCPGPTQDGLVVVARVQIAGEEVSVRRVDYVPIYVRRPDFAVLAVGRRLQRLARAGHAASAEAVALRASLRRTVGVVGRTRWTRPL